MWMLINCLFVCSDSDIVCQGHSAGRKGVRPTWVSPLKEAHKGFIGISQFCRPVSRHFRRNPQSKVCFHALFGLNRNSIGTVCPTLANVELQCRLKTFAVFRMELPHYWILCSIYLSTFNLFEHNYDNNKWRIGYYSMKFLVAHMTSHCL